MVKVSYETYKILEDMSTQDRFASAFLQPEKFSIHL